MKHNYYFQHAHEIAKEHGDWFEQVNRFDRKHGTPENCDEQRREFLRYTNHHYLKDGEWVEME